MDQKPNSRLQLHVVLEGFLPTGKKAYFQPPNNLTIQYPCIVYQRDYIKIQYADNVPYKHKKRYQVTTIDEDPDSDIPDEIAKMPYSSFQRGFVADNLHHSVFTIYF